ncbi:MAG: CocE/NonD family hydrolase [Fimbriimonadaceae bacterium]|nr:CocE/NonD family hydrolase [Fimbriimonadaceae bacterium]
MRRVAIWLAVCGALVACGRSSVAQDGVKLAGQVTTPDGRPVPGLAIGIGRLQRYATLPDAARVTAERQLRTDAGGRFSLTIPPGLGDLSKVVLFTASPIHGNVIYGGVTFDGPAPTAGQTRAAGVKLLDLGVDNLQVFLQVTEAFVRRTELLPMHDGAKLATDLYLPAAEGRWPVILTRTPYNKIGQAQQPAVPGWVAAGIAVVVQDARGRFASSGENLPFWGCGWDGLQDGVETLDWIAAQPWCNGKICTVGGSAGGITQILTAAAPARHLTAQSIGVAFSDSYRHAAYPGGAFSQALIQDWLTGNKFDPQALALFREHQSRDAFWERFDASARADRVTVPALFSGGWFDVFNQGTLDSFMERQHGGGPGAKGTQRLVMGPWPHGRRAQVGELTFPENAMRPPGPDENEWLQFHLKGTRSAAFDTPPVVYYRMGAVGETGAPGNDWQTAADWPMPCTPTPWFAQADGTLSPTAPTVAEAAKSIRYDPANPVPTRGGHNLTIPAGPYDQRPLEQRSDVLVFTSAPLAAPLEITGRVTAKVWVSSSAVDTDVTVKLTDVYPDGRSMLVLDGIRRLRYRLGFTKSELLTPGQVYEVDVDLWSTSLVLNQGHRLRVALSSSNHPRFAANPNTAEGYGGPASVVATNTFHLDRTRPTQIILPVVSRRPGG